MRLRTRLFLLVGGVVAVVVTLVVEHLDQRAPVVRVARSAADRCAGSAVPAELAAAGRRQAAIRRLNRQTLSSAPLTKSVGAASTAPFVNEAASLAALRVSTSWTWSRTTGRSSSAHWPARFGYQAWATNRRDGRLASVPAGDRLPGGAALGLVAVRAVFRRARGRSTSLAAEAGSGFSVARCRPASAPCCAASRPRARASR